MEVGFRPGVTDNVGRTAREAIEYLTGRQFEPGEGVYYSRAVPAFSGALPAADVEQIATGLLCNTLIQRYTILSAASSPPGVDSRPLSRRCQAEVKVEVKEIDLEVSDEELLRISREGVLALTLEEMQIIQAHYRNPAVLAAGAAQRARRQADRCGAGVPGPDLVGALQAQDLCRDGAVRG